LLPNWVLRTNPKAIRARLQLSVSIYGPASTVLHLCNKFATDLIIGHFFSNEEFHAPALPRAWIIFRDRDRRLFNCFLWPLTLFSPPGAARLLGINRQLRLLEAFFRTLKRSAFQIIKSSPAGPSAA
jgi:hypothetical protein